MTPTALSPAGTPVTDAGLPDGLNSAPTTLPSTLAHLAPVLVHDLIRVGSPRDGGYVIPASVYNAADALASFGVSIEWSFETAFHGRHPQAPIHAYDHTVGGWIFAKEVYRTLRHRLAGRPSKPSLGARIAILLRYLWFFRGTTRHYAERIGTTVGVGAADIATVFSRIAGRSVFVKCDIEGSEYEVIPAIMARADRLCGLAIEFHDTDTRRAEFLAAIAEITREFAIVHVHANNYGGLAADGLPAVLEISFARVPAITGRRRQLPVPTLDAPNWAEAADYTLVFPG